MKEIKLIDRNFTHTEFTTQYQSSDKVKWVRNFTTEPNDIVVITDDYLSQNNGNYRKVGMIMEPRAIKGYVYDMISLERNYSNFETILTYDKELLAISDKFEFYPHCGCWIQPELQKIYEKSKLLSIIASNKRNTIGHNLRHEVIGLCNKENIKIDCFGSGYQPVRHKIEALENYFFSVVIENSKQDYYFTEKLMDAFITGTIPIYWGCPSIGDFFNLDGMIILEDLSQLDEIISSLSPEKYNEMLVAVKENFETAKKYLIVEEWLYATENKLLK